MLDRLRIQHREHRAAASARSTAVTPGSTTRQIRGVERDFLAPGPGEPGHLFGHEVENEFEAGRLWNRKPESHKANFTGRDWHVGEIRARIVVFEKRSGGLEQVHTDSHGSDI